MFSKIKISFDWDDTASIEQVRTLLHLFDRNFVSLYIITARSEKDENRDIKVAQAFEGWAQNVTMIYLDGGNKWSTLEKLQIDYHFDDMVEEIALIQQSCTKTMGFLVSTNIGEALQELNNLSIKTQV